MFDGKAISWPGMKGANRRQIVSRQLANPLPRGEVLLTPTPKRAMPELHDMVAKGIHALAIGRHGVVCKVTAHHLRQPATLPWNRFMHPTPQFRLDVPEPRSHSIPTCFPFEMEGTGSTAATDESEARKIESFRLSKPSTRSIPGRKTPELDQTSFLRMQRQSKPL